MEVEKQQRPGEERRQTVDSSLLCLCGLETRQPRRGSLLDSDWPEWAGKADAGKVRQENDIYTVYQF